uniref:B1496_C2_182 n=1 Tax=Mycobacterium leprae TaxID=1769 RepID=Q49687_MYCLR|nr:B1496_C2_182 [Mycobacterium leprae]
MGCSLVCCFASLPQLPAGEIQEHVFEAVLLDPHIGGQHIDLCAPSRDGRQHLGVDGACDQVLARSELRGLVVLR